MAGRRGHELDLAGGDGVAAEVELLVQQRGGGHHAVPVEHDGGARQPGVRVVQDEAQVLAVGRLAALREQLAVWSTSSARIVRRTRPSGSARTSDVTPPRPQVSSSETAPARRPVQTYPACTAATLSVAIASLPPLRGAVSL